MDRLIPILAVLLLAVGILSETLKSNGDVVRETDSAGSASFADRQKALDFLYHSLDDNQDGVPDTDFYFPQAVHVPQSDADAMRIFQSPIPVEQEQYLEGSVLHSGGVHTAQIPSLESYTLKESIRVLQVQQSALENLVASFQEKLVTLQSLELDLRRDIHQLKNDVTNLRARPSKTKAPQSQVASAVAFFVGNSVPYNASGVAMSYDTQHLNLGNGMDIKNGIFTAPVTGIYNFAFSGVTSMKNNVRVILRLNGRTMASAYANKGFNTLSLSSVLQLRARDQVWLQLTEGVLYEASRWDERYYFGRFTGFLLQSQAP